MNPENNVRRSLCSKNIMEVKMSASGSLEPVESCLSAFRHSRQHRRRDQSQMVDRKFHVDCLTSRDVRDVRDVIIRRSLATSGDGVLTPGPRHKW